MQQDACHTWAVRWVCSTLCTSQAPTNGRAFCHLARQDVSALLSKGASDAHREAAALREAQLGLKLEAGRHARSDVMIRQKVCTAGGAGVLRLGRVQHACS